MSRFARKFRKWTVDVLDLPPDLIFDLPRLSLTGNKQLHIENHRGVLDFSPTRLLLAINEGTLEVQGEDLIIKSIMTEDVLVEGTIMDIKYRGTGEKR